MKPVRSLSLWHAGIIFVLALSVLLAGCTQPGSPAPVATPGPAAAVSPAGQPSGQPSGPSTVPVSLSSGVTISVPADWVQQGTLTTGVRDYGRDTQNLGNFVSPNEIPGDSASSNSLSIDVDKNVGQDFDTYFNKATLALGKSYGTQMESHSITLKISGYDSYELDFKYKDVKGTYIFTNVKGTIYIFAWKGTTKPIAVTALQGEIVDMYKSIQIKPA